jgi:hypothetical protein
MPRIKLSSFVDTVSGKMQSVVYQKNGIMRIYTLPSSLRYWLSSYKYVNIRTFQNNAGAWSSLTGPQKQTWNIAQNFTPAPKAIKKEEPKKCGYNLFQSNNSRRSLMGLAALTSHVVPVSIPFPPDIFTSVHVSTSHWDVFAGGAIPSSFYFVVRCTKPSLNKYPYRSSNYFTIYSNSCNPGYTFNIYSYLVSKFPTSVLINSFFSAEVFLIEIASGYRSPSVFTTVSIVS